METIVAPSILSADFGNLNKDILMIDKSTAQWIHLDVMDGIMVPSISFGFPVIKAVRKMTNKVLDAHLMIVNPDLYIKTLADIGVDRITVHLEACPHLDRTIACIHDNKMKAAVAVNPHTQVHLLEDILPALDMVLIMSVNPGFGCQKFIENTYSKLKRLHTLIENTNPSCLVQVDGGVNISNYQKLVKAGVNCIVAGSYVFSSSNPTAAIKKLQQ